MSDITKYDPTEPLEPDPQSQSQVTQEFLLSTIRLARDILLQLNNNTIKSVDVRVALSAQVLTIALGRVDGSWYRFETHEDVTSLYDYPPLLEFELASREAAKKSSNG